MLLFGITRGINVVLSCWQHLNQGLVGNNCLLRLRLINRPFKIVFVFFCFSFRNRLIIFRQCRPLQLLFLFPACNSCLNMIQLWSIRILIYNLRPAPESIVYFPVVLRNPPNKKTRLLTLRKRNMALDKIKLANKIEEYFKKKQK